MAVAKKPPADASPFKLLIYSTQEIALFGPVPLKAVPYEAAILAAVYKLCALKEKDDSHRTDSFSAFAFVGDTLLQCYASRRVWFRMTNMVNAKQEISLNLSEMRVPYTAKTGAALHFFDHHFKEDSPVLRAIYAGRENTVSWSSCHHICCPTY